MPRARLGVCGGRCNFSTLSACQWPSTPLISTPLASRGPHTARPSRQGTLASDWPGPPRKTEGPTDCMGSYPGAIRHWLADTSMCRGVFIAQSRAKACPVFFCCLPFPFPVNRNDPWIKPQQDPVVSWTILPPTLTLLVFFFLSHPPLASRLRASSRRVAAFLHSSYILNLQLVTLQTGNPAHREANLRSPPSWPPSCECPPDRLRAPYPDDISSSPPLTLPSAQQLDRYQHGLQPHSALL